ncbi:MAG: ABC transporter substrate-binding protein [bacterium]|nr:ABC transporter substrate-binding protein [bacterium]
MSSFRTIRRRRCLALALSVAVGCLAAPIAALADAPAERLRVATLLPFVEDAVRIASDRAVVVASVRRSVHSPLAEGVIDLGNPHGPNMEKLAEARPDVVIGDASVHARFASALSGSGAKLLMLETSGVDSTLEALSRVSEAIGGSAALDEKIDAARDEIARLSVDGKPKILTLFGSPGTFYVMTDRAWLGDLAKSVGFEATVSDGGNERFPGLVPVSDEIMAIARPDLVLLIAHGNPTQIRAELDRRVERGGPWAGLAKARLGVHVLDPMLFSANPGLALTEAAKELVRLGTETQGVGAQ